MKTINVKFVITVGKEIYGAHGLSLYLMTGAGDITTCADIVNISELLSQSLMLKIISWVPIPGRALLENGIRYRDSDFTVM